ncbi:hypothetical protein DVB69_10705 [Sporosarcina sp. BI001-red]|uniref:hypothetical protein n=1 Tax=Sporosarcina sp. BI001-red TaxID=2282866 RepID=UPI000E281777|nr:hypothetical protein [Sporosarcina sp. BI001-red]REB07306.1 hypothetical protein DVB69_10705 [Sporosarcina sp. BI001-red]
MKRLLWVAGYGLIGGLILTFLFKWIESATGEKVYTFLLNVDYIPRVGDIGFPEWIEILFHLVISVAVALGFYLMYYLRPSWKQRAITICTVGSVVIGLALFPTTALSERTPEITDGLSLLYWLMGHAIFGAVLGTFFKFEK